MKRPTFACALALSLAPALAADAPSSPSAQLHEAVAIADAFIPTLDVDPAKYKLVAAVNMYDGRAYKRPAFWRVTYKSCGEHGVDVEPVCKGGEIYVAVDMATRSASFIGAGE